jgi:2-methylcitrate dehydratase
MNAVVDELAEAAAGLRCDAVPADVRELAALLLLDTVVCALGGADAPVARQARRAAVLESGTGPCTVFGDADGAALGAAALSNGVAARYLDLNDTYLGVEPIHPSDTIPSLLALAEQARASGAELITAIVVAYEALCRLCDSVSLRGKGFDGIGFVALATALGASRLLGVDRATTGHALSIAATEGAPLLRTRVGELATWKAVAGPAAACRGLRAALLAAEGVTGPPDAFAGKCGYQDQISGPFTPAEPEWRMRSVRLKVFPAQYFTHTAIEAALTLRARGVRADEVEAIAVRTYSIAYETAGSEPVKWAPATRETADHSLPYCVGVALTDGELTARQFSRARLQDKTLRGLLAKITVDPDADLTARYPDELPCLLTATLTGGRQEQVIVDRPPGDPVRGYGIDDVLAKARALDLPALAEARIEALANAVSQVDGAPDLTVLSAALAMEVAL